MKQLLVLVSIVLLPFFSLAQDTSAAALKDAISRKVFFLSNDQVEITLVSDFKKIKGKKLKKVFQPATVTLTMPHLAPVTEEIQIAARGEFRRVNCIMPSLALNFKSEKAPKLKGLKNLKLVCGCSYSAYDEELLLKEYLVYKIYNQLTNMSFGVRLAKLNYKDEQSKAKEYSQYGFLIEDLDDLAKRNECHEFKKKVASGSLTDHNQMMLVSMFQYMIGNTDWSLPNNHNVRYVQVKTDTISFPYVVPYDFDYCGLVNAPYAIPQPEFGIERVTDRYYRGIPGQKEQVAEMVKLFKEKQEVITSLIMNFDLLKKSVREGMVNYINSFYKDLDNQRKLKFVFEQAVDHY